MIDTHSHLLDEVFKDDLDDCIKRCKDNNVNKIVLVGFERITNNKAQELSKKYDIFYPTAGIHPEEVKDISDLDYLEDFIKNNKVYAIGECGLDYHWTKETKELQKIIFEGQIKMSIKYNLPLIIHSRDAIEDTYNILEKYKGQLRGVMHCYSGSLEMAQRFLSLGLYIGLDGPVTFKNAKEPKRVAENIPLDRLLLETDCPWMTPSPYRGKRNESSYVVYVCEEIAKLRNMTYREIEEATDRNASSLFNI
ncbi:MAG: TatD family hydrolase [Acholeplasmatales bacterium]|nr:TatD family hydrolase [Acholeplasmatales bacterium]